MAGIVSAMNGNLVAIGGNVKEVPPMRLVYRLPEAGQLLGGITRKTVRALINRGELQTTTVGAYEMVTLESILAYIERGKKTRAQQAAQAAA